MNKDYPLTPELAARWSTLPFLQYKGRNGDQEEWSAACPKCGDNGHEGNDWPDRFTMFGATSTKNARGWCRRCAYFSWADENTSKPISRSEYERIRREREELKRQEDERTKEKIRLLNESQYWKGWHDALSNSQRDSWHRRGVPDFLIDKYQLGYVPDKRVSVPNGFHTTDALSIPHIRGCDCKTVQFRLQDPPNGIGKYRFMPNLPSAMFATEPEDPVKDSVIVVEGAIKAMIVYLNIGSKTGYRVVAIPSKTPSEGILAELSECDRIVLALDPDAYMDGSATRIAERLGPERAYLAFLPDKPDDLFTEFSFQKGDFMPFIRQARRIS